MKVSQVFLDDIAVGKENKTDFQVIISVFSSFSVQFPS